VHCGVVLCARLVYILYLDGRARVSLSHSIHHCAELSERDTQNGILGVALGCGVLR